MVAKNKVYIINIASDTQNDDHFFPISSLVGTLVKVFPEGVLAQKQIEECLIYIRKVTRCGILSSKLEILNKIMAANASKIVCNNENSRL